MNDILVIFRAELMRKLRSRPFVIGTLLGALAVAGLSAVPHFVLGAFNDATRRIVLAGDADLIAPAAVLLRHDYTIVARLPHPAAAPSLADLNVHSRAAAFIILERGAHGLRVTAYVRDPGYTDPLLARDLVPLNIELATSLPAARIRSYLHVDVRVSSLDRKFADPAAADSARGVAYLLVLLLYMSIVLNSQNVMASVAEEKTSRIAELLVATTSPARLLTGKIGAAGVAGLLQLTLWGLVGAATGSGLVAAFGTGEGGMPYSNVPAGGIDIPGGVIAAFAFFFAIGFVQYATLYAAAASLINRTEDLGGIAAPLVIPVIGGFFLAQYTLAFPHAAAVTVLAQIPLVSPFVMFTRMAVTTVPPWQIGLAVIVNAGATVAIVLLAGKVYRVGLLLYGRPPNIRQIVAVLRA